MSQRDTIRARRRPDGTAVQVLPDGSTRPLASRTDWRRLDAMTEGEIEANARADPENPPLSPAERARLTQEQFAARFGVPLGALRDWEQGTRQPDSAARTLLRVIDKYPEVVIRALEG